MVDILHTVTIKAPAATVYDALATGAGVARWWSKTSGKDGLGEILSLHFGENIVRFKVIDLVPGKRVAWECVEGAPDWIGTRIEFDLREEKGATKLLFAHRGWAQPVEFMHHCSTKWAVFMLSLKALGETGEGTPFPKERRIA